MNLDGDTWAWVNHIWFYTWNLGHIIRQLYRWLVIYVYLTNSARSQYSSSWSELRAVSVFTLYPLGFWHMSLRYWGNYSICKQDGHWSGHRDQRWSQSCWCAGGLWGLVPPREGCCRINIRTDMRRFNTTVSAIFLQLLSVLLSQVSGVVKYNTNGINMFFVKDLLKMSEKPQMKTDLFRGDWTVNSHWIL